MWSSLLNSSVNTAQGEAEGYVQQELRQKQSSDNVMSMVGSSVSNFLHLLSFSVAEGWEEEAPELLWELTCHGCRLFRN